MTYLQFRQKKRCKFFSNQTFNIVWCLPHFFGNKLEVSNCDLLSICLSLGICILSAGRQIYCQPHSKLSVKYFQVFINPIKGTPKYIVNQTLQCVWRILKCLPSSLKVLQICISVDYLCYCVLKGLDINKHEAVKSLFGQQLLKLLLEF